MQGRTQQKKTIKIMQPSKKLFQKSIGIISAGFHKGQPKNGVQDGPEIIKKFGLISNLENLNFTKIQEYPALKFDILDNEQPDGKVKFPETTAIANKKIADAVFKSVSEDQNDRTLVLGGDHSIAIGSLYAHSLYVKDQVEKNTGKFKDETEFCCLWIDAHADINTAHSSYSGNLHGQCLSYLLDSDLLTKYVKFVRGFDWITRKSLRPERLAYIGLRDIDSMESLLLDELGITYCSMNEVDKYGIDFCLEKCLDKINPSGQRSTHVSFDIDALDPDFAPSTGTPVPGGLSLREAQYIGEKINRMGIPMTVMDLVEVNPSLLFDFGKFDADRTARHANYVIESFMGRDRGGDLNLDLKLPRI